MFHRFDLNYLQLQGGTQAAANILGASAALAQQQHQQQAPAAAPTTATVPKPTAAQPATPKPAPTPPEEVVVEVEATPEPAAAGNYPRGHETSTTESLREREHAAHARWEQAQADAEEERTRKRKEREWREYQQKQHPRYPEDGYGYSHSREEGGGYTERHAPVRAQFGHSATRHVPREFRPPDDDGELPTEGSERELAVRREESRHRDPRDEGMRRRERDPREEAAYIRRERDEAARRSFHHGESSGSARHVREEARSRHEEGASGGRRAAPISAKILSMVFLGRRGYSPDIITSDVIISRDNVRFIATVLAEARKKDRSEAAATPDSERRKTHGSASSQELEASRKQVAILEAKIKTERIKHQQQIKQIKESAAESEKTARRESERALRAYMKSAVHALHRLQKDE